MKSNLTTLGRYAGLKRLSMIGIVGSPQKRTSASTEVRETSKRLMR